MSWITATGLGAADSSPAGIAHGNSRKRKGGKFLPDTLSATDLRIIALAKDGLKPKAIWHQIKGAVCRKHVERVVRAARQRGEPINSYRAEEPRPHAPRRSEKYTKPRSEPMQKPNPSPLPLDYFELRALKKLLGADLAEIEADAEAEGVSLATYVRNVLRAYARRIKA